MHEQFPTIPILFEDAYLLVINKPPGVVVNRAASVKVPSLQDWMDHRYGHEDFWTHAQQDEVFASRSGLAHRIDKDTSGVLLLAKQAEVLVPLMEQFQTRQVEKEYWALVHGHLPTATGIVKAAIIRNPQNREKFTVSLEGRESTTRYQVLQEFAGVEEDRLRQTIEMLGRKIPNLSKQLKLYEGGFSLVSLIPKTGRTHQIRVHMDFLHHPLVGDARYTGKKRARLDELWCPRQWLHAHSLTITHPVTKERITFIAPVTEDLQRSLEFLRQA